jgi:hypothetical protein
MGNNGIIGGGEKEPLRMIGRAIIFELPTKKKRRIIIRSERDSF